MAKSLRVGGRIYRNYAFLRKLAKTKSINKRIELIRQATKEELLSIIEIATNVVKYKTFCFNKRESKKLAPYDKLLKQLTEVKSPTEAQNLLQKGGAALLPALLVPVLVEIARSLFN